MEQDAPVPKVAPKIHSSQHHTISSRASHGAWTFEHPNTQEMDLMTTMLQRLDS